MGEVGLKNEKRYQLIAGPGMEGIAEKIALQSPTRFIYHPSKWGKLPDGFVTISPFLILVIVIIILMKSLGTYQFYFPISTMTFFHIFYKLVFHL